jgi:hypothetical protein
MSVGSGTHHIGKVSGEGLLGPTWDLPFETHLRTRSAKERAQASPVGRLPPPPREH